MNKTLTLLGVPIDLGAQNLGVDVGPNAFRYQKIVEVLESLGFDVTDAGNVSCKQRAGLPVGDNHARYLEEVARVCQEVATKTHDALSSGSKLVALGGDHSLNLGVVSGASSAFNGNLGLIYLDAHGDMNTPETTPTGNIHGMHVAALLGSGPKQLTALHTPDTKITPKTFLHIGGSDFDASEHAFVKEMGLVSYDMFDILTRGLGPLITHIDQLSQRVGNVWVSLDLDVIDMLYAPGAGMPNRGGLAYREIAMLAQYIGEHCNVVGIDVVEYNPLHDVDHKTADLGIELIAKFLGKNYNWYTGEYLVNNKVER